MIFFFVVILMKQPDNVWSDSVYLFDQNSDCQLLIDEQLIIVFYQQIDRWIRADC